ncbi:TetR family transcriptional regulator [Marinagarivorans cellulosilyticus]
MKAAGITRGAFYAHFKHKAELYQYAIIAGAKYAKAVLEMAEDFMS